MDTKTKAILDLLGDNPTLRLYSEPFVEVDVEPSCGQLKCEWTLRRRAGTGLFDAIDPKLTVSGSGWTPSFYRLANAKGVTVYQDHASELFSSVAPVVPGMTIELNCVTMTDGQHTHDLPVISSKANLDEVAR